MEIEKLDIPIFSSIIDGINNDIKHSGQFGNSFLSVGVRRSYAEDFYSCLRITLINDINDDLYNIVNKRFGNYILNRNSDHEVYMLEKDAVVNLYDKPKPNDRPNCYKGIAGIVMSKEALDAGVQSAIFFKELMHKAVRVLTWFFDTFTVKDFNNYKTKRYCVSSALDLYVGVSNSFHHEMIWTSNVSDFSDRYFAENGKINRILLKRMGHPDAININIYCKNDNRDYEKMVSESIFIFSLLEADEYNIFGYWQTDNICAIDIMINPNYLLSGSIENVYECIMTKIPSLIIASLKSSILQELLSFGTTNWAIYKSASSASRKLKYMMEVKGLL